MMQIPKVDVPEGTSGSWKVERFTVSKKDAEWFNLRNAISGRGENVGRDIEPGAYTKLVSGGNIVMSDTPAEMRDHQSPILHAKDHCLINGLGLGMIANAMLLKPEVLTVTVIEKS